MTKGADALSGYGPALHRKAESKMRIAIVQPKPVRVCGETDLTGVLTRGSPSACRRKVPLSGRTATELKEYCKAHNLDLNGARATLVDRVRAHAARHPSRAWEPP